MNDDIEVKNAIIKSAHFDMERGLSAWIMLDYGDSCQGFGGYLLYAPEGWRAHNTGGDYTGHFIWRCLQVADACDWGKLPGKSIRVRAKNTGVLAIGHITKDLWFDPAAEFKALGDKS